MRAATLRLAVAVSLLAAGPAPAAEILPLSDVRPGMVGVGRTVFGGSRIDEFRVEVIGVLANAAPRRSIILARLAGGPLAETGVIAGMSGSPVFIGGRLVGAVAYGFPFSKETIAGLTPIQEMIETTQPAEGRLARARLGAPWGPRGPAAPLDREALVAPLRRRASEVTVESEALRAAGLPAPYGGAALTPLALPLSFAGFDPAGFDWARRLFRGLGFLPVQGGAARAEIRPPAALEPGAAVAVSLIEGDLDLSASGTVTHVDGGRVYAFGHPFLNLGPTRFPMKTAHVYSVFPNLYQSWKIAAAGEAVGTIEQDRITAIAGRLGPAPRLIPVTVNLRTSRGQDRSFAFRIVDDELFSPVLTYLALGQVLQGNERAFGAASVRVEARVKASGGRIARVDDLFTAEEPGLQAAALVAAPVAHLMANDFEPLEIEAVEVDVSSRETRETASLERAWIDRTGRVLAGSTVPLRLRLRTYRGETRAETVPIAVPASLPPGHYTVLVADGAAVTALEQREMRQPFVPRDLDQLLKAINGLRKNNHLYVRLLRAADGAILAGEYLPSLPPSVLSVLTRSEEGRMVVPLRTATVWEVDLATDYAVSGTRVLSLTVEH
jgi:hypothetical protein